MAMDTVYLTVGKAQGGGLIAVASRGSPQRGDKNVEILAAKPVATRAEAEAWFSLREWETRQ